MTAFLVLTCEREPPPLPYSLNSGKEIVVFFIGAKACGTCDTPELRAALAAMRDTLSRRTAGGVKIVLVGVDLDWVLGDGLDYLRQFGTFDQETIGRNWLNTDAVRLVWRDSLALPALPQVVVVEHDIGVGQRRVTVTPDYLLTRRVGAHRIANWVDSGAPLPALPTIPSTAAPGDHRD